MKIKGEKIVISRANMNRLLAGTHKPWQVLQLEGAVVLVKDKLFGGPQRLPRDQRPCSEIVGVDIMELKERYLAPLDGAGMRFRMSPSIEGVSEARVKECILGRGLPALVVE